MFYDLLHQIEYKWRMIGVVLAVEYVLDDSFQSNKSNNTRLYKLLESWINTISTDITWETITAALKAPVLIHNLVARKIQQFLNDLKIYSECQCKNDFVQ